MDKTDVRKETFAMPLCNPSYLPEPYQFINREFFLITSETDLDLLLEKVSAPLTVVEPLINFEFNRMRSISNLSLHSL